MQAYLPSTHPAGGGGRNNTSRMLFENPLLKVFKGACVIGCEGSESGRSHTFFQKGIRTVGKGTLTRVGTCFFYDLP